MEERSDKTILKKVFGIIGISLFFASFLPYFFIASSAALGVQKGLFGGEMIFGLEAAIETLIWLCIIPIIPVCLIYEIFFFVFFIYRKNRKFLIRASGVAVSIVGLSIVLPCIIFAFKERDLVRQSVPVIREYLAEKYGDEMVENIDIKLDSYSDESFRVYSSVLPPGRSFTVYEAYSGSDDSSYNDDLVNTFRGICDEFDDDFALYLAEEFDLPENITPMFLIESIDFTGYEYGDDYSMLFPFVSYRLSGFLIDHDELNDDIVIAETRMIWNDYVVGSGAPITDWLHFVMKLNGKNAYSVQVDPPADYNGGNPTMKFSLYNPVIVNSDLDGKILFIEEI